MSRADFPLSQLITDKSATSQRWFAQESVRHIAPAEGSHLEITDDGLLILGMTEDDLERAYQAIMQRYPGAEAHKPQVRFIDGPPLQEPYYQMTINVPEYSLGDVMGDLNSRRATIALIDGSGSKKRLYADIPVCESFGYRTSLRSLTRGEGSHEVKFIGYRPSPGWDDGDPLNVA